MREIKDYTQTNNYLRVEANKLIKHKSDVKICEHCGATFKRSNTMIYCRSCESAFYREEQIKRS